MNTNYFYNEMMCKLIQYTMHHSMQVTYISKLKVSTSLVITSKYSITSGIHCKVIYRRKPLCTIHVEDLKVSFMDYIRAHIKDLDFTLYLESDINNDLELLITPENICVVDQNLSVRALFTLSEQSTFSLNTPDTLNVEMHLKSLEIDATALSLGNFIVLLKQLSTMYTQQFHRSLFQSLEIMVTAIHINFFDLGEVFLQYMGLYVLYQETYYKKIHPLVIPNVYANHMSHSIGEGVLLFLSKVFFQRTTEDLTKAYNLSESDWLQIRTDAFDRYQKVDFMTIKYTLCAWVKERKLSSYNDPYYHINQVYIDLSLKRNLTKVYPIS